jgi:hypothetical protein
MRRLAHPWLYLVVALLSGAPAAAQHAARTYVNPLDIDYRYNFEQSERGISYRSSADPVIVPFRDEYYLFATIAGGYWRSADLGEWTFIEPSRWPMEDIVAPAALAARDTIFLLQSTFERRPLLYTTAPETGRLEFYNRWLPPLPGYDPDDRPGDAGTAGAWDPALFRDDARGRWFLYWGSSNLHPLWGVELDTTRRLAAQGERVELLRLHPEQHGWERFGQDHRDTIRPYVEGAWMTKHGGRYYLQYGAPGTEYNVYANGTYVGDAPLGPFTYAPYSPVAYRPGGFATGAGHGNTFQDHHGNFWNTGTTWVGVNWNFERRLVMHPAGFHADGQMYADTRFGDFPHYLPTGRWTNSSELFTGWMLLSYRATAHASSARDSFPAAHITDEDPRTFWVAVTNTPAEWLALDLRRERTVRAVQVNYADYQSGIFASDSTVYTQFRLQHSRDGETWQPLADLSSERRDRPNAYIELPAPVRTRYIRYEHGHVGARNLAISDIRVFGNGDGEAPATPRGLRVERGPDRRDALIRWRPVPGAVGYNVLWGIAPDRLHQAYQVFADQGAQVEIRALNVDQAYSFAVEAFDENGVSPPGAVVSTP